MSDRDAGTTSDPLHLVKRKAVGSLVVRELRASGSDGTMIYGDELAPSGGNAGGGIYKFVPGDSVPGQRSDHGAGAVAARVGNDLRAARRGLGLVELGPGRRDRQRRRGRPSTWPARTSSTRTTTSFCATPRLLQKFTGYYRPEDMDIDPIAAENGVFRACWANTGRKSHTDSSVVENSGVESEVMCLVENPPSTAVPAPPTGTIPTVDRFITGSEERGMFDNVAFQPHTGNLVVLEDGLGRRRQEPNAHVTELRGNDLWICLPDGDDDDALTDGCVRFASIRDTSAEPSGFIFFGSGEEAFVNIQHRAVNDAHHHGALIKISGFKVKPHDRGSDDDGGDRDHDR